MSRPRPPRVLAIGIDAAEPSLVHRLIDQGDLPSLKALRDRGLWGTVHSPAAIGSGAVWPTFMTGQDPLVHEVYSVLPWDPRAMRLVRLAADRLTPFWQELSREGYAVGVLDVPFAPVFGLAGGVEISEWGAHDRLRGGMLACPPDLREWLARTVGAHPLGGSRVEITDARNKRALRRLAAMCRKGARLRGTLVGRLLAEWRFDVLIAVFPEIHHAAHYLWHTLDSPGPAVRSARGRGTAQDGADLLAVYREVDAQIGQLTRTAGEDAFVLVFSLHGMRPTRGIPAILDPLLRRLALAAPRRWGSQTWAERRQWSLTRVRGVIPHPLRGLYRRASRRTRPRPQQEVTLPYDWSKTAVFPVPTDQHGWLRVNLSGREAEGTVPPERYGEICTRVEEILRRLRTSTGDRVVTDVLRLDRHSGHPPEHLPDLIVHWDDHALADPLRVDDPPVAARATGTRFTGQHAPEGFFILRPPAGRTLDSGSVVAAADLHRLIRAALKT